MQFEVAADRLENEFGARLSLEHLPYTIARRLDDPAQRSLVDSGRRSEVLTRTDGTDLALFIDQLALGVMQRMNPELAVSALVAGAD
jgi:peptide chain release factor 3